MWSPGGYFSFRAKPDPAIPRTASDYRRLSRTLLDQKRFTEAEQAAKAALVLEPAMYKALIDLGRVYLDTGNYVKAAAVLEQALRSAGDDRKNQEVIYYNLGLAYAAEQKEPQSWDAFRKAYAIQKVCINPVDWNSRLLKAVAENDRRSFTEELPRAATLPGLNRVLTEWDRGLKAKAYAGVIRGARRYLADNPGTIHAFAATSRTVEALDGMSSYAEAMRVAADGELGAVDAREKQKFASLAARSLLAQKKYQESLNAYAGLGSLMADPAWQEFIFLRVSAIIQQSRAGVDLSGWLSSPMPEKYKRATQLFMAEQLLRWGSAGRASSQITELISLAEQPGKKTKKQAAPQEQLPGALPDREQKAFLMKTYYLASSIYEADNDLPRAKLMVHKVIRISPFGPRGLPARLAYVRLMHLDIKAGDYESAFKYFLATGFGIVLNALDLFFAFVRVALFIVCFGWFSRRFFPAKWQELRSSEVFRLKDLGMFMFLLASLGPQLFIPILAGNYYSGGALTAMHLDPILLSSKIMQIALIFVAVYVLRCQYKLDYPSLGFVSRGFKVNILLPLAVFLAPIAVALLLSALYIRLGAQVQDSIVQNLSRNIMLQKNNAFDVYFLFMSLAVFTPIAEEIVFRLFIFKFIEKYTNVFWAVCLSAILFAYAHEQRLLFPYFLMIGVILAIIVHKTKSIVPCFVLHAMYNSIAFFAFFFG